MLSIVFMTLLDLFDDCEILFFSVEEGNCVMDADIDVTGEIEFFDGGVKFDVIWFRELIDVDIVDSSDIVWVDISLVEVAVSFGAGKFSFADVTALILHFRHLKKRLELFFLSSVLLIFLNSLFVRPVHLGCVQSLQEFQLIQFIFFLFVFLVFLTGVWLRGWWCKQIEQIQAQSDFWDVSQ